MVESGARGRQVQVMRVETLAGASQAAREGGVQLPGTVGVLLPLATSGDIREWSPPAARPGPPFVPSASPGGTTGCVSCRVCGACRNLLSVAPELFSPGSIRCV